MTIIIILLILILIALVFGRESVKKLFKFILSLGFWLIVIIIVIFLLIYLSYI